MADVTIETFLAKVIEDACAALDLKDDGGTLLTTHPDVVRSARLSYSLIKNYCHREFHTKTRTERYELFSSGDRLHHVPVVSIATVKVGNSVIAAENYQLANSRVFFNADTSLDIDYDDDFPDPYLYFVYEAGRDAAELDEDLFMALVQQTVGVFNGKCLVGLDSVEVTAMGGFRAKVGQGYHILDEVTECLSGHRYYGSVITELV